MKKLFIILVIVILITLALIGILFLIPTPSPQVRPQAYEPEPAVQQPSGVEPPGVQQPPKVVKEFDDSIFNTNRETQTASKDEVLKAELQLMARNFIETYGSFSSSSGYGHIEGLYEKMTPQMGDFVAKWLVENPALQKSSQFYSIQTRVLQTEMKELTNTTATISVETNRIETDAGDYYNKSFNQKGRIELKQVSGEWKVDGVFWE